jgi:putative acyl-CoA dehydrogenase
MARDPSATELLIKELDSARGGNRSLDKGINELKDLINDRSREESEARRLVEFMAIILQGALLVKHGPASVSDPFCASRLGGDWGRSYGTLPRKVAFEEIVALAKLG